MGTSRKITGILHALLYRPVLLVTSSPNMKTFIAAIVLVGALNLVTVEAARFDQNEWCKTHVCWGDDVEQQVVEDLQDRARFDQKEWCKTHVCWGEEERARFDQEEWCKTHVCWGFNLKA